MKKYPDPSPVFEQKAARRKQLATLSFEEKIAIVNKWRKLTAEIRKYRESSALPVDQLERARRSQSDAE
jgi:hypothetical protein